MSKTETTTISKDDAALVFHEDGSVTAVIQSRPTFLLWSLSAV